MNPIKCVFVFSASILFLSATSQNPFVQTIYTADPAPMVYDGTLYVYTTHDEQTTSNFFTMYDWQLFSTTDMVNWTAHGTVASLKDFEWSDVENGAWAPQCIERNGKFYLYCPIHGDGIGVLVADNPYNRVEAETIAWSQGVTIASDSKTGVYVTDIGNGDYIKVRSVDFRKGAKGFEASVASATDGGLIEIRLGGVDGTLLGTCKIKNTGGLQNWDVHECDVSKIKGIHDLYFVFRAGDRNYFNFDWWMFNE